MQTNISYAKANLSRLLEMVQRGEDIIIAKAGKPIARMVPYDLTVRPRRGGIWQGKLRVSEDFDTLPKEVLDAFEGGNE